MSRNYIGITSRGPTTLRNVRKCDTGEPLLVVNENEAAKLVLDYTDWLETGETISSVSAVAESCSVSVSTASPQVTLTISAVTSTTYGKITLTITTSTSQVRREVIRVRRESRYGDEQNIRDYV